MSPSPWRKERSGIKCCYGCKPPKRYPGCGDHCPEYKKEKAKLLADKEREKKELERRSISYKDFYKF